MVRKGGSRISFTPHSTTARSKNGGMTPFVERPSPPRALKSTQEPPFPAHRRAGGGSRCVGGLLEVGENGNSWGSTAQPRSVQEGCSWGGDRRHAHPGLPAGNRRSAARTATAGDTGGGDPSESASRPWWIRLHCRSGAGEPGSRSPSATDAPTERRPRPPRPLRPIPVRGGAIRRPRGSLEAADRSP